MGGVDVSRRREELAKELAISHCELIKPGSTVELGTIMAMLVELIERLQPPEDTMLIEPTVSSIWARHGLEGQVGVNAVEMQYVEKVKAARHLYIIVQSENPPHYTLVEVHKNEENAPPTIEFRESLQDPPPSPPAMVERILRKLGIVGEDWRCPPRCNSSSQTDPWSCGLWATRYIERSLRERRGEGRSVPASISDMTSRANEFISKIKKAGQEDLERQAKAKAKAKSKAKAKAKAQAEADERARVQVEPVFETLEEALEAAKLCKKCLPTKFGTKGCRACMGEFFEQIRLKAKSKN